MDRSIFCCDCLWSFFLLYYASLCAILTYVGAHALGLKDLDMGECEQVTDEGLMALCGESVLDTGEHRGTLFCTGRTLRLTYINLESVY